MIYNNHNIDRIIYASIHSWIRYKYGRADKCENKKCKNNNIKRFEWAFKKGKKYENNNTEFEGYIRK